MLESIAQAMVALPLVVRTITPVLRSIEPRQRQVAASLGAAPWRVLATVDLPVAWRPLLAATGFAFAVSLGEFGATSFLAREDRPTLPVVIYRLIGQPGPANFAFHSAILDVPAEFPTLRPHRIRIGLYDRDGDRIVIDVTARAVDLDVPADELARRAAAAADTGKHSSLEEILPSRHLGSIQVGSIMTSSIEAQGPDTGGLVEQSVSTRLSSTEGGDSADSPGLPRRSSERLTSPPTVRSDLPPEATEPGTVRAHPSTAAPAARAPRDHVGDAVKTQAPQIPRTIAR